jgi:hypothetical protein
MKFHLLGKSFGCDFSRSSEPLDLSRSCLPKSIAMRNLLRLSLVMLFLEYLLDLGSMIFTTLV